MHGEGCEKFSNKGKGKEETLEKSSRKEGLKQTLEKSSRKEGR
jgi:hypothetical protein